MRSPIPYQIVRAIPGKRYVCELVLAKNSWQPKTIAAPFAERRLAGPFDTDAEADAASGAIEAEHRYYRARTEVWLCAPSDTEVFTPALALATPAAVGAPAAT